MIPFRVPTLLVALVLTLGVGQGLTAQAGRNPVAGLTRSEIQAALDRAEKIISSPGYSGRIKQSKRKEIALLRARLENGDLQPGDQVILSVQGEKDLSGTFTVTAGRFITLPGVTDVSLRGVLRAELPDHLAAELRKYLKDPVVHVQTTVRVSILGSVGRPGFYQVSSEAMIGDAIMLAGGPTQTVDPAKTSVERWGAEIITRDAFSQALTEGKTLDQMNLLAGDEILVGTRLLRSHRLEIVFPQRTVVLQREP